MEGKGMVGRTYFIQLKHPDDIIAPSACWRGDGRSWPLINSVVHCSLMVVGACVHRWVTLFVDGRSCSLVGVRIRCNSRACPQLPINGHDRQQTNANAHQRT